MCPLRGAVPNSEIDKIAGVHAHSCAHAHITEPTRFRRGAAKDRTPAPAERPELCSSSYTGGRPSAPHTILLLGSRCPCGTPTAEYSLWGESGAAFRFYDSTMLRFVPLLIGTSPHAGCVLQDNSVVLRSASYDRPP
ncbi:hypothetical protein NDU88_007964 [Pleurodeles waltl]|uniref:Uncharacterized protein n=1 Tax=Pleurodeles waltl TaxID=8319 RepID=A0AAV7PMS8_PLEWA|nr:hypothetical protein NDU88_007964 [Pleurodeles waltl]